MKLIRWRRTVGISFLAVLIAIGLIACGPSKSSSPSSPQAPQASPQQIQPQPTTSDTPKPEAPDTKNDQHPASTTEDN
jgi:hypothetical protein